MRAREAAKQDQLRARHRLSKFLLRHGRRAPAGAKLWTLKYMAWIRQQVQFEQPAQEYARLDYLHEVEHANDRVQRLEEAIREAVKLAPRPLQEVVQALQALRGIAQISAATMVSELDDFRFRPGSTTHGVQRGGGERGFQWKTGTTRCHY